MITINCIENINSINLTTQDFYVNDGGQNMELLVENWLCKNKEWFKNFALENLDLNTVEKWLRSNDKKICKCCNSNNININVNELGVKDYSKINTKRNSLSSSIFISKDFLQLSKFEKPSTKSNASSVETNGANVNFFNKDFPKEETPKGENSAAQKSTIAAATAYITANQNSTLEILNKIGSTHSHTCIIHNRPFINSMKQNNLVNMSSTILPYRTEELNDDFDDDNENTDESSEQTNRQNSADQVFQDNDSFINNFQLKNKQFDLISNNSIKIPFIRRNSIMRKYQPMYACDSNASLSVLKMLIETKIKFPTNSNSTTSLNDKLKMKRETRNESEFLLELVKDISNELNLKTLSTKILNNLKLLVNAEKASLFYVCHMHKCLASFKFDPHAGVWDPSKFKSSTNSFNYDTFTNDFDMEFAFGNTLLGSVAQTGNVINIPNASKDKRYNSGIDNIIGYQVKSLLCLPIKNAENEVIAVVQVINKSRAISSNGNKSNVFDEHDIKLLNTYLPYCAISIVQAQLFDLYAYEYERNKALLEVVHDLFEQQTNLDEILFRIMQKAQTLLKCQRCSVLVVLDKNAQEGNANARKVFDLFQSGRKPFQRRHSVEDDDGSKISNALADHVIKTGEKINLSNAYDDPRFDPLVDTIWKFKTKGILCMPIRNRDSNIIGCAQIANRLDNQPFDENDEQLFEAFCIFCGLGINNTLIYDQLERSMAEKSVALEVLSYHATCSKVELNTFVKKFFSTEDENYFFFQRENLNSFVFDDFSLNTDEMIMAAYEMFKHSGLLDVFKIEKNTLIQWLLTVRKNYRDIVYHNWNHAFNVCQSMFAIFENSKIANSLQDIEKLGLIVGCLCHDLDHRGTNNMFQVETHSALSQLYGTTGTMEKHHFNHCIMILNTPGHNIFSQLKPRTYSLAISYIKEAILATDLADHFSIRRDFDEAVMSEDDPYWGEEPYCSLLRKHLMTCCDLASSTKPWLIHRDVVNLVTKEFFAQGDRERLELNKEPNEMMDARRSHELPRLQIGWIDNVCLPLYSNLLTLDGAFEGHIERVKDNRTNWSHLNFNRTSSIAEDDEEVVEPPADSANLVCTFDDEQLNL